MNPDDKTVVLKQLQKLCINWPMDFKYYSSLEERDLDGANRREENETGERLNGSPLLPKLATPSPLLLSSFMLRYLLRLWHNLAPVFCSA